MLSRNFSALKILASSFVLTIFLASTALASPLETSFCPAIPDGINFGDSSKSVLSKIDQKPEKPGLKSRKGHKSYYFTGGLPADMGLSFVNYDFKKNKLEYIGVTTIYAVNSKKDANRFISLVSKFNSKLSKRYGQPIKIKIGTKKTQTVHVWQVGNQEIIASPPMYVQGNLVSYGILIRPKSFNKPYDFAL